MGNNELGINAFSGPMGEKEPAYGAVERAKVLSSLAPVGSPAAQNAPRRAKQRALRGKRGAPAATEARATANLPDASPVAPVQQDPPYQMQVQQFWTQLAAEPGASDQVKQYAAQVAGNA